MTTPLQGMIGDEGRSENAGRILVVDDEEIIRALLSEILTDEGFEVVTASDGSEAIELLNREQFDLVISDMVMPKVGGIEVLQEAFRIDPDYSVIIITGYPSVDTAVKLVNLGAADYITKPFNVDIIKITVAKVIEMKRVRGGTPEAESQSNPSGLDAVTGVYSQAIFFQLLSNELGSSRLRNQDCSLIVMRPNHSEVMTSSEGMDRVLKSMADHAINSIRPGDTIGRTGESEIAIIMPQTNQRESENLIRELCSIPHEGVAVIAGSACYPQDGESPKSVLIAARSALVSTAH